MDWEIPNRAQFFERFGRICRPIRFDKRGTGLSDRPIAMATLEQRTDDSQADEGQRVRAMPRRIRPRAGVSIAGRIRPVVWRSNMANPAGVA